ncbi:MAG: F0F1 ATP synthase subunit delta [Patescibacteria group bacterium]
MSINGNKAELYAKACSAIIKEDDFRVSVCVKGLVEVLKKKKELYLLPKIMWALSLRFSAKKNPLIISAHPLTLTAKEHAVEFFKKNAKEYASEIIDFLVDKTLIGGVKIIYNDFLFDGTIKGSLEKLRNAQK